MCGLSPPHPDSAHPRLTLPALTCSSKSTGDPWLTDGSYLDGSGFARISVESQLSNTKRFDQELRLVSYSGIIFFMQHQARPPSSRPGPPARPAHADPPLPPRTSSCAWPCGRAASCSSTTSARA